MSGNARDRIIFHSVVGIYFLFFLGVTYFSSLNDPKAVYFFWMFVGVLVVYCIMMAAEPFMTRRKRQTPQAPAPPVSRAVRRVRLREYLASQ